MDSQVNKNRWLDIIKDSPGEDLAEVWPLLAKYGNRSSSSLSQFDRYKAARLQGETHTEAMEIATKG